MFSSPEAACTRYDAVSGGACCQQDYVPIHLLWMKIPGSRLSFSGLSPCLSLVCRMLGATTHRASYNLLSTKSLELRSLILLVLEEAFTIFSTGGQGGAACPAAQVAPTEVQIRISHNAAIARRRRQYLSLHCKGKIHHFCLCSVLRCAGP